MTQTKAIETQHTAMHCDACHYEFPVDPATITEAAIGTRCPNCAAVMITEDDYRQFLWTQRAFALINDQAAADPDAFSWADQPQHMSVQSTPGGPVFKKSSIN